jgi:hypothetical protein
MYYLVYYGVFIADFGLIHYPHQPTGLPRDNRGFLTPWKVDSVSFMGMGACLTQNRINQGWAWTPTCMRCLEECDMMNSHPSLTPMIDDPCERLWAHPYPDPRSSDFHHLISDSFDTHPRWTTGKSKAVWCLADPLCSRAFRYVLQKAELLEQNQNCGCLHLPVARLNVSTVGVIPGIRKLTEDRYRFTVSIFCRNVAKCAEIWGCHMLPQLVTALVTFADTCFLLHHKNMAKIC